MSAFRSDLFADVGSDITSAVYFVGDAEELTADARIASATTVHLQGTNAQGFREAIAETAWSTLTQVSAVAANTIYNIEPGFRWIRGLRETASTASWSGLHLAGRNTVRRGGR